MLSKKKRMLEKAWKECLAMWKWIDENIKNVDPEDVDPEDVDLSLVESMKKTYAKEHNVPHCSFCEFTEAAAEGCQECPGALVDPAFHCFNDEYLWEKKPREFYQELLRLNRIRKRRERKKDGASKNI